MEYYNHINNTLNEMIEDVSEIKKNSFIRAFHK